MWAETSMKGRPSLPSRWRAAYLAVCMTAGVALAPAAGASASVAPPANPPALAKPIKIAQPEHFGDQSVGVDQNGAAYIAWPNQGSGGGEYIQYCLLPAAATACLRTGTLTVSGTRGGEEHVERVQVLVDGSTVIVLAFVYGVGEGYAPVQEWQAPDGSVQFSPIDAGRSVAYASIDTDSTALGAVIVPGSGALGYATVTPNSPPAFDEFPLSSPPECWAKMCPASERFAMLQTPSATPLGNPAGRVASQLGPDPGVLAVYETLGRPGPAEGECTPPHNKGFGTAFSYGNGEQTPANSYDASVGSPGSAWQELAKGDCEAEYPAVGGGASGFGVVEDNLKGNDTVYHAFDERNHTFDTPYVPIAQEFEENPSVSQDGSGGVYATFTAGFEGAVRLAYSPPGAASWEGPATLAQVSGDSQLTSDVGSGGQGWATWRVGESLYAEYFVAANALPYVLRSVHSSSSTGSVEIELVPDESGTGTLEVTVPTASVARAGAGTATAVRCKAGQIVLKGRCVPATTVAGKTSGSGKSGHLLALTVAGPASVQDALSAGRKLTLTARLTYKSSHGARSVQVFQLTVKGRRR